ncbi:hypothetical protein ACWDU8_12475 [Streptomyces sp. NPDC003388]|uniref:hypothetical protein n=1 Tax=unclassified Streptomyces TaxID=2593676 RepID=UPI001167B0C2|nr:MULTISPECIES: hypothetical protein [unclassified Streptomyces]MDI1456404.1 hypothetical protein [Streptomyces sp. ATE26]GEJ99529.1 hypothetical protein TNCT1_18060 [Streptomyces sp. 1-11]
MKTKTIGRLVAVALGLSVLATATPAFADQDIKVIWGHGYRTDSDHGVAAVKDLADDDNEVYVQYTRAGHGSEIFTLWNKKGKGTTTYSGHGGTVTIKKVCRSISLRPDVCFTKTP